MDSKKLALLCREFADNRKAENVVILDVRELSSVTDYFVIASGTLQTAWVVLDFFDVIMHVMRQEVRERYDLETLWGDAPQMKARKRIRAR